MTNYLIVGAGLFGATCARLLADAGHGARVIEQRGYIGGNCADEMQDGFRVNLHGGHIFHTNAQRVWDFLSCFTGWTDYTHRVRAYYQGQTYQVPPTRSMVEALGMERVIEMFYDGYSLKQWGKPWGELPGSVRARMQVRDDGDERYFTDRYQGLPRHGYTELVREMLDGLQVDLDTPFMLDDTLEPPKGVDRVIYSGPLDALFDYQYGRLQYRSLRWQTDTLPVDDYQGCATVNYTEAATPWTRILEWKHFGPQADAPKERTRVTMEWPADAGEPYYPVGDEANRGVYRQYASLARGLPWLTVGGRLGSYQYLNMDQAIAQAMEVVNDLLA